MCVCLHRCLFLSFVVYIRFADWFGLCLPLRTLYLWIVSCLFWKKMRINNQQWCLWFWMNDMNFSLSWGCQLSSFLSFLFLDKSVCWLSTKRTQIGVWAVTSCSRETKSDPSFSSRRRDCHNTRGWGLGALSSYQVQTYWNRFSSFHWPMQWPAWNLWTTCEWYSSPKISFNTFGMFTGSI